MNRGDQAAVMQEDVKASPGKPHHPPSVISHHEEVRRIVEQRLPSRTEEATLDRPPEHGHQHPDVLPVSGTRRPQRGVYFKNPS
jgi:hypothetical protein